MEQLLKKIRNCKECESHLAFGVNPIVAASAKSKVLIIGQAPGRIVHKTSIPWNDKSGDNLRNWLGVEKEFFYDTDQFALMPMGLCYPGSGKTGDLPPRIECAPLWHPSLIKKMRNVKLILLVGSYAQKYYLKNTTKDTLTETVKNFNSYLPLYFPLPHPSPRNNIWQKKNSWFGEEVIPQLRSLVAQLVE
jgi:uracil-DNA glycosylase